MKKSVNIHPSWHAQLLQEFTQGYWGILSDFVKTQYSSVPCFPEGKNIFRAFDSTPFETVKIVILGQDPYHTPGAAMGLSFSVPNGSKAQPSLQNIFKELFSDLGIQRTQTDLSDWAAQGIFLLNAVLTVESGKPASHAGKGWEEFTNAVISQLSKEREGLVFILWGNYAIGKRALIDEAKHTVITSSHPSPFSAHKGFFGSRPFSRANEALKKRGIEEVKW